MAIAREAIALRSGHRRLDRRDVGPVVLILRRPARSTSAESAFSLAVSCRASSGGGMRSSGSAVRMRLAISLSRQRAPARAARTPSFSASAPSRVSRRRSALRLFLSNPWQRKQASARIERTSRLYSDLLRQRHVRREPRRAEGQTEPAKKPLHATKEVSHALAGSNGLRRRIRSALGVFTSPIQTLRRVLPFRQPVTPALRPFERLLARRPPRFDQR